MVAELIGADKNIVLQAATLAKCDLATEMVGEFPELQGIMGKYYALHDGLDEKVAHSLEQYYWPRFAKDLVPKLSEAASVALADKLDSLVGIIGVV